MVKVSIVVPVYNVDKYLRRCLNSLVNQSLKEIEIIVVNDGSPDSSQEIIEEFAEKYPNKIIPLKKENGGLSDARNYGIPFCQGKYIGFVDSDDYVDMTMYELLYASAEANDSDIVTCDYYKVYGNKRERVHSRNFKDRRDMLIGPLVAAWNKIYRRELLIQSGVVFPKGLIYEDTAFFSKLAMYCSKTSYVDQALVFYIQREGSIANSQGHKTAQIFDIFHDIVEFYKKNGFYEEYKNELEYYCLRIAFGSNLERISRIKEYKLRKELSQNTIKQMRHLFPEYLSNVYLMSSKSKRHLFIRLIRPWNIGMITTGLYFFFSRRDKALL